MIICIYVFKLTSIILIHRDPKKVIISGSNDSVTWEDLHSSELEFLDRVQKAEFIIDNEKKYKHYSIQFKRSDDVMQIGNYGLVEAYTKACTSELYASITGVLLPVYSTSSPTNAPTNVATEFGHEFKDKAELLVAVNLWGSNEASTLNEYGHIRAWRVGKVYDMSSLFRDQTNFNADISRWDTSSVGTFNSMFHTTSAFNCNISDWNFSSMHNRSWMFYRAKGFDQILCWDTSKFGCFNCFLEAKGGSIDANYPNC